MLVALAIDLLVIERHFLFVERNVDVDLERYCVMDVIAHCTGVDQNVLTSP